MLEIRRKEFELKSCTKDENMAFLKRITFPFVTRTTRLIPVEEERNRKRTTEEKMRGGG